ncbi:MULTISPECIES: hypothetical protein [unclassified Bradyrhizobium]|uniref:hypothetical protein n=1 Tax=unclassified Bradyrhizobium TaxID=2631580 RepID=UPI0028E7FF90|nr:MULTISPECIES: hypothetical protein [unclassified Bradyrhizobium]
MSNKPSSYPLASNPAPLHRFGGVLASTPELAIHALGDVYAVEGTGTVRNLPASPKGPPILLIFVGTPTFAHSLKLLMPGAQPYTFSPGDSCWVLPLGDGVWRVLTICLGSGNQLGAIWLPQGRLTPASGVAITISDQTAVPTIFYIAGQAPFSDGTNIIPNVSGELSINLDATSTHTGYHQAGKNFDVFKVNDGGTIRIGTGPAWASDNARGTGAGTTEVQVLGNTGVWVNANPITLRWGNSAGNTSTIAANCAVYLGSFRTTADGQTEDSLAKRFVWNAYAQAQRETRRIETTASWNYSTATIRQANGNSANQIEFIFGLSGGQAEAELQNTIQNSTATIRNVTFAIALDSTTTTPDGVAICSPSNAGFASNSHKYRGMPGIGYHKLAATETGAGSDTQTWYGGDFFRLYGSIWG